MSPAGQGHGERTPSRRYPPPPLSDGQAVATRRSGRSALSGQGEPSRARRFIRNDVDAVALTDPDTLMVSGGGVGLVKAVFDAAQDGDRQRPTGGLRLRTGTFGPGRKDKAGGPR